MHVYANPARFLKIARPLTPCLGWSGAALIAGALYAGLFLAPPERLQGESVRIIYLHVPAAWLAMGGWTAIAIASLMQLVWRHPLAAIAARAAAVPGAVRDRSPIRVRMSGNVLIPEPMSSAHASAPRLGASARPR
jgi:heme exporter protein C